MPLIEIRNLAKCYDLGEIQVHALKSVNVDIEQGEFVALIGPSGSGKSTLMNTLGCLDRPTGGSYLLAGEEVVTMNAVQRANLRNRRIGFVFQNFNLLSRTTAVENVELPLMYSAGFSRRQRRTERPRFSEASASAIDSTINPISSRVDNSSASPSLAHSSTSPRSSWRTNRRETSIPVRAKRSCSSFRKLNSEIAIDGHLVTHDMEVARQARRILVLVDGEIAIDTTDSETAETVLRQRTRLPLPVAEVAEPTNP